MGDLKGGDTQNRPCSRCVCAVIWADDAQLRRLALAAFGAYSWQLRANARLRPHILMRPFVSWLEKVKACAVI